MDLRGSTILITGGTGSFGTTLIDRLESAGCDEVRVLSRDESKQDALRRSHAHREDLRLFLGDVRDRPSIDRAMRGVDLVFHAAALKQVPSCEFFPTEAVATNVGGSRNVIDSAIENGTEAVVLLSTDKAVYPINAMGMSKALMEKVGQAAARELLASTSPTRIMVTRYGNVLYSRGSVIPAFVAAVKAGQPLRITDPTMTRFLLPLSQSVELVEHAWQNGSGGDVFVRRAPACTVGDLAQAVQNIFDREVGTSIIGIRHGEKLHETLATMAELARAETSDEYFRIPMDDRDLRYSDYFDEGTPSAAPTADYDSASTEQLDVAAVERLLLTLPEIQDELSR